MYAFYGSAVVLRCRCPAAVAPLGRSAKRTEFNWRELKAELVKKISETDDVRQRRGGGHVGAALCFSPPPRPGLFLCSVGAGWGGLNRSEAEGGGPGSLQIGVIRGGIGYALPLIPQAGGGGEGGMITEHEAIRPGLGAGPPPRNSAGRLSQRGRRGRGHPSSCVCAVDSRSVTPPPPPPKQTSPPLTPLPPLSGSHTSADSRPGQI